MEAAGYMSGLASSPTKRIQAPVAPPQFDNFGLKFSCHQVAYLGTCSKTPAQKSLPKSVVVVLRLDRVDFIEATREVQCNPCSSY